MDYSDDDISASREELDAHLNSNGPSDDSDQILSGASESDLDADMPSAAVATSGTAADGSAGGLSGDAAVAAQDALMSGEMSTNAALLQLQVELLARNIAHVMQLLQSSHNLHPNS